MIKYYPELQQFNAPQSWLSKNSDVLIGVSVCIGFVIFVTIVLPFFAAIFVTVFKRTYVRLMGKTTRSE